MKCNLDIGAKITKERKNQFPIYFLDIAKVSICSSNMYSNGGEVVYNVESAALP